MTVWIEYEMVADKTLSRKFRGESISWTIPAGTIFELPAGQDPGPNTTVIRRRTSTDRMPIAA